MKKKESEEIDMFFEDIMSFSPGELLDVVTSSWIVDQDNKPITLNTTISAGMNKYPSSWINGVSSALGISKKEKKKDKIEKVAGKLIKELDQVIGKLPPESVEALRMVVKAGGWIKFNQLSKKFGEGTDSYFWDTEPPTSTVGLLRLHALIFVGRANIYGKRYLVAVIPKEIREDIAEMLK
jgi:hypothetical protein